MKHFHEGPHKYIKKKIGDGGRKVWKCMLPGCPHYIQYHMGENRHTLCWRCNATIVLDKITMELTRPHCKNCTKTIKEVSKEEQKNMDSIKLLTELFGKGA